MALTKNVKHFGLQCNEYARIEEVRITPYTEEGIKKYEVSILVIHYTDSSKQFNIGRTKLSFTDVLDSTLPLATCYGMLKTREQFSGHEDC